jgi:signal transduction histidine kinase
LRLTLTYGGLFLLAGVLLLTITNVLTQHAAGPVLLVGTRPTSIDTQPTSDGAARALIRESTAGLPPAEQAHIRQLQANAAHQRASDMHQLLVQSSIALAITAILAVLLGWFVAGRVLRPLRTMTATTQLINQHNLDRRLALRGPDDEVKNLADTIDDLLDRIEAAFDAQRRFVANASHELRTPLTWQRALIDVTLANPHAGAATFRAACQELLASAEEQERLTDALLTLASSERGLDRHDPTDLAAVTRDVLLEHQPAAATLGLTISTDLCPAPVSGNLDLIKRLVANLLANAVRHNTESGRIDVDTRVRDGRGTLTVSNTGPVVPRDDLDRLLQPFQRLTTPRTGHPAGHGLGLSIVSAVATAHHADLDIQPRPDGGLRIEVSFPAPPHGLGHIWKTATRPAERVCAESDAKRAGSRPTPSRPGPAGAHREWWS